MSQDDLAARARHWGLSSWTQSTVAAVEAGRQELSLGEYHALVPMLELPLADLFPADDTPIRLGPDIVVTAKWIRNDLGRRHRLSTRDIDAPPVRERVDERRQLGKAMQERTARLWQELEPVVNVWPGITPYQLDAVHVDAGRLAERRAAARLGTSPVLVAAAAHKAFGHGLTVERDRRIASVPTSSPATRKALAGHVTRSLLAEIKTVLAEGERRSQEEVDAETVAAMTAAGLSFGSAKGRPKEKKS
jgi:hypothetical protein